ncbi:unnamed protein product [Haemonchus placei]|uniref:Secreted protein n=1 Tax=Haemonchus placei TaxID=6290 RepID=A0A0N4WX62_HAEPC|nr:unnamed protein product [Haemonchus placei]
MIRSLSAQALVVSSTCDREGLEFSSSVESFVSGFTLCPFENCFSSGESDSVIEVPLVSSKNSLSIISLFMTKSLHPLPNSVVPIPL